MKRLFVIFSFAMMYAATFAVPAKPGQWKTVKLADGTEVRVELRGDEFCNYWQAADGRKFVQNVKTGLYDLADNDLLARRTNEHKSRAPRKARGGAEASKISYTGLKKGLIILVQFSDTKFNEAHTPELYERIVNERGFSSDMGFRGSVKDYFYDQSYGQIEFDFDIIGPVTMPNGYAYYGQNGNGSNNVNIGEMVIGACKAVDGVVDFSQYDWDGDGEVEQVFLVYAGHGEASYGKDPNTIWPHKWSIYSATYPNPQILTLDGVVVDTYACSCELGSTEAIDGIGAICHEFSHCLGLPDMYDSQDGDCYGTASWDLMNSGCYNGNSFCPASYTAYERMAVGWMQPIELTDDTTVESMKNIEEGGEAYIIYNDGNRDEYYMLENRQRVGWDSELAGSGLLITHIDYNSRAWNYNVVNSTVGQAAYGFTNPHEMCSVVAADNRKELANIAGDAWPYGSNVTLSNTSVPAADLYNANSDGSMLLNKSVKNITKNSDGTISFAFENENKAEGDYDLPQSYLFYESFDQCSGTGGNDGRFNASTTGSVVYDNTGWSSPSSRQADRCGLYGSQTIAGQATTPQMQLESGVTYTLLFKAVPYTGSSTTLTLEVAEGDAVLAKTSFIMKQGEWSALSTTLEGGGATKLRFKGTGRFYLDKVCVTSDTSSGITYLKTDSNGKSGGMIYDIYGRLAGKDINVLPRGIYIKEGKKVVKK